MILAPAVRPSVLDTEAPEIDEAEASALAAQIFGVAGTAHRLTSERDRNFRLDAADGRRFVLKVTNSAEQESVSDFQTAALLHIAKVKPDIPVPRVCPAHDGRYATLTRIAAGSHHLVRLLTYLPGEVLHRTLGSMRQTESLGRCLAELGLALEAFRHPAAGHELLWDLKGALRVAVHLGCITDSHRRALAQRGLARFEAEILPRLPHFRSQVVHNDFNPHNILVDAADPTRVTGVLDFGDMVETPLVNDVAVAASYQCDGNDPMPRLQTFVAAYHAVRPLLREELDVLFDLIVLRHVLTVTITEWRAALYPDNKAYILRNQPRAAAALEALDRIGRVHGTDHLRRACHME